MITLSYVLMQLAVAINPTNIKKLLGFFRDRLSNKPMSMTIEAPDGRKLNVKASSQAEFEFVLKQAQEFLKA